MMPVIKKAILKDKLYFHKSDVQNLDKLIDMFTYTFKEETFTSLKVKDDLYSLPSNCNKQLSIEEIKDQRIWEKLNYDFEYEGSLRTEQQKVVNQFIKGRSLFSGLLQAKCGWGKTFTGCSLIAHANAKAIILVHTKLLFYQWIEELETQFPHMKIGRIGDGLFELQDITVGIYKSVSNNIDKVRNLFSLVLVDECNLAPAEVFSNTLNNLSAKVKIGISATPTRRDGKHLMLPDYFTDKLIVGEDIKTTDTPRVRIIPTNIPFFILNPKRDWAKQLTKLYNNDQYLNLIAREANHYISNGRCLLIQGDRVIGLKKLHKLIPSSALVIGATVEEERNEIISNMGTKYGAILTTNIFDYGVSCHRLDTLVPTTPSANLERLEQRIGRLEREHPDSYPPLIVDFELSGVIVQAQLQKRIAFYNMEREKPKKNRYDIQYG